MLAISGQHAEPNETFRAGRNLSAQIDCLEADDHRELNQPRVAVGIRDLPEAVARRGAGACRGSVETLTRNTELRMVEEVEEFGPELDPDFLGNRGSLEDGEVKVLGAITAKHRVYTRLAAESPVRRGSET